MVLQGWGSHVLCINSECLAVNQLCFRFKQDQASSNQMHIEEQLFRRCTVSWNLQKMRPNTLEFCHGEIEGLVFCKFQGHCNERSVHIQPFITKTLLWNGMHIILPKARSRAWGATIWTTCRLGSLFFETCFGVAKPFLRRGCFCIVSILKIFLEVQCNT